MTFNELAVALRQRQQLPVLCPEAIDDAAISHAITTASDVQLFGSEAITDEQKEMHAAVRAGLLLWNDDLDASHTIAQSIETPTGSAWHAIMHRREGDFSNSKYWYRRVGEHPAFPAIFQAVQSTLAGETSDAAKKFRAQLEQRQRWQPETFVDICQDAITRQAEADWMRRVQLYEMTALLDWCAERC
jgi:hypothetical protein